LKSALTASILAGLFSVPMPARDNIRKSPCPIESNGPLLDRLPLFATDDEIAIAIVGKKRASEWKRGALLILEARGFPRVDAPSWRQTRAAYSEVV
jgi:hypothetical protein